MADSELFKQTRLAPISLPVSVGARPKPSISVFAFAPMGGGPPFLQLSFTMQKQMQDEWCWAAVSVSVCLFYSPISSWTQCSIVCAELGVPTCCTDGSTPNCDRSWTLNTALARTGNLNTWTAGTLSSADIQSELAADRAIGCRIGWSSGGGHFVALTGYEDDGTTEIVVIDDPWYGRSQIPLKDFTTSYQSTGTWTHSYYTQS